MKLGVNIDHIATLRNARGQDNPSILRALKVCEKVKVDTLTVHLREDRRHINDSDLKLLKKHSRLPINLEMALTDEMILISKRIKPNFICLVPEKRNEITTEGGLNLEKISKNKLKSLLSICHSNGIELSAFINPNKKAIDLAKKLQFQTVELHTGSLDKIKINNSHGLNFSNIKFIKNRKKIDTVHIGHFIISESIFLSLHETIKKFQRII